MLVLCVGVSTLVLMPRPVVPQHIPLPTLDLVRFQAEERERLELRASVLPLGYGIRVIGELFRRFGRAEALQHADEAEATGEELRAAVRSALKQSSALELSRLRTLQTDLFLHELQELDGPSAVSSELEELAGGLSLRLTHWWTAAERPLQDSALMGALFRLRWGRVTGTLELAGALAVSSNDWRRQYRLQLKAPNLFSGNHEAQQRLQAAAIGGLAAVDVRYPSRLAQGVLQYARGRYGSALTSFRAHLSKEPGSYQLLTQNYAAAAAAQLVGIQSGPATR